MEWLGNVASPWREVRRVAYDDDDDDDDDNHNVIIVMIMTAMNGCFVHSSIRSSTERVSQSRKFHGELSHIIVLLYI